MMDLLQTYASQTAEIVTMAIPSTIQGQITYSTATKFIISRRSDSIFITEVVVITDVVVRSTTTSFAITSSTTLAAGYCDFADSGSNNIAYNNLIYNGSSSHGIGLWTGCNNCAAYNNTVYNVGGTGIYTSGSTNAVVRNNISFSNGRNTDFSGTGTVASNNLTTDPQFEPSRRRLSSSIRQSCN